MFWNLSKFSQRKLSLLQLYRLEVADAFLSVGRKSDKHGRKKNMKRISAAIFFQWDGKVTQFFISWRLNCYCRFINIKIILTYQILSKWHQKWCVRKIIVTWKFLLDSVYRQILTEPSTTSPNCHISHSYGEELNLCNAVNKLNDDIFTFLCNIQERHYPTCYKNMLDFRF